MSRHMLVLGGQRSGKSRFAEGLIAASGLAPVYLATATAGDGEMAERISRHRGRRGGGWRTVEEPLEIATVLRSEGKAGGVVLVECLTLWVANLMAAERDLADETAVLISSLAATSAIVVFVSNEVGGGIVPDNALARRYADALGTLNQNIAAAVDRVVLVASGQPLLLKPARQPEITL